MTAEKCVDFDYELSSFHRPINSEMIDWRTKSVQEWCNEYINKEWVELDSEDDKKAHDSNKGNNEQEPIQLKLCELSPCWMVFSLYYKSGISEDDQSNERKNFKKSREEPERNT